MLKLQEDGLERKQCPVTGTAMLSFIVGQSRLPHLLMKVEAKIVSVGPHCVCTLPMLSHPHSQPCLKEVHELNGRTAYRNLGQSPTRLLLAKMLDKILKMPFLGAGEVAQRLKV